MFRNARAAFILAAVCVPAATLADPAPHPASPEQGTSPPATQGPSAASRKADETMSEKSPRPMPGKDSAPGPAPTPPIVKRPQSSDTTPPDEPPQP